MLLNLLLPPRCVHCGVIRREAGSLCQHCWQDITFVSTPWCKKCGEPLLYEAERAAVCASCPFKAASIKHGRAAILYDSIGKALLLKFKNGDRTDLTPLLASWLARSMADIADDIDMLVPVPLHARRQFSRRYNQAGLLAAGLSKKTNIPVCHALKRVKRTADQKMQKRWERQRNVAGAFQVSVKQQPAIAGQHVAVVDDVWTTGATLLECAKTLRNAGAKSVSILAVARVKNTPSNGVAMSPQ